MRWSRAIKLTNRRPAGRVSFDMPGQDTRDTHDIGTSWESWESWESWSRRSKELQRALGVTRNRLGASRRVHCPKPTVTGLCRPPGFPGGAPGGFTGTLQEQMSFGASGQDKQDPQDSPAGRVCPVGPGQAHTGPWMRL